MENQNEENKEENSKALFRTPKILMEKLNELKNSIFYQLDEISFLKDEEDILIGQIEKFKKVFGFKFEMIISTFLEIEKEIMASPINDYFFILFGIKDSKTKQNITRLLDSILMQYFAILDIFVKFLSKIEKCNDEIDSLGSLYFLLDKEKLGEEEKKTFKFFIDLREGFEEIKSYRDYLIHHGNLQIGHIQEEINEEYFVHKYLMYEIKKHSKKEYKKSKRQQQIIHWFLRDKVFLLVACMHDSLFFVKEKYEEI